MIKISTNIKEVYQGVKTDFDKLIDADKALRTAVLDSIVKITHRIQQKGQGSNNNQLQTKSPKSYGAYSEYYGKKVRAPKYQTTIVDLTFTGDMFSDFVEEPSGKNQYSIGFRGDASAQKAEYLELYYGDIFSPSVQEENDILEDLDSYLNDIFR